MTLLDDETRSRYAAQKLVIGADGQKKLADATVCVVGAGALGSVSCELLARAGVGHLRVIDRDVIDFSNLQRQILYTEDDVGKMKADVAALKLKLINSEIVVEGDVCDVNHKNITDVFEGVDIIVDGTDNVHTRHLINEFSRKNDVPWVYAGSVGCQGNVMVITESTPCFFCVFEGVVSSETCDTAGVLGCVSSTIASIQANEVIRFLTGGFESQELLSFDMKNMHLSKIRTEKKEGCCVCDGIYEYLSGAKEIRSLSYQCEGVYTFFLGDVDVDALKEKLEKVGNVVCVSEGIFFENISVFRNGRVIIRADSKEEAQSVLAKYIGV